MPHCIIEITENLSSGTNLNELMQDVAIAINANNLFIDDDIKVRIYEIKHSFMGTNIQDHSYVTAELILLNNKTDHHFSNILKSVQDVLMKYFKSSVSKNSITSRITFIDPKYYQRYTNY